MHRLPSRWRILRVLLLLLAVTTKGDITTCINSCSAGDTLNAAGTVCTHAYAATVTYNCDTGSGWALTPPFCSKDLCTGTNSGLGSRYVGLSASCPGQNTVCVIGNNDQCGNSCPTTECCKCYYGGRAAPVPSPSGGKSCREDDGGPGGAYTRFAPDGEIWCYFSSKSITCPGKYTNAGGTCQYDARVYTCPQGGSLLSDGVTCRRTYPSVPITTMSSCRVAPSGNGCSWCDEIGVCMPTGSCYADCYAATADRSICTRSWSLCQWCASATSIGVCQPRAIGCYGACWEAMVNRPACVASSDCHWCLDHGGRCKPVLNESRMYVRWRADVECTTGTVTSSSTGAVSSTMSSEGTSTSTESIPRSTTMSLSLSTSLTVSSTSSVSLSQSPSQFLSQSRTPGTATVSSASLTPSFRLPPCNATHAAVLAYIWPHFFNFTTTFSAVISAGFPDVDVTGDLNPALIYQVPLLLRQKELEGGHPVLTTPNPYEPPNDLGFVHRSQLPVRLNWLNRSTIRVGLSAIPDYWLDTSEDITIDVPFEQIVYCNRTDPVSVWVPPTIQLIGVHIIGPEVNEPVTTAMQAVVTALSALALVSGDGSASTQVQTLAVISISSCGVAPLKNTVTNYRVLGPLPVGIDGFLGVLVGNVVLVCAAAVTQFVFVAAVVHIRRISSRDAAALARAPSLTVVVSFALFQGTFFAAAQLLTLPDSTVLERVVGAVMFFACLCGPVFAVWWCHRYIVRECVLYDYKRSPFYTALFKGMLQRFLLPRGRIEPPHIRQRFSSLVSGFVVNRVELPVLSLVIPYLLTLLTLWHPSSATGCSLFMALTLVFHLLVAAWILYWMPFRFTYNSVGSAVGYLINGALLFCCILALSYPRLLPRGLAAAIALSQIVLQLTRMILMLVGMKLEEHLRDVPTTVGWANGKIVGGGVSASVQIDLAQDYLLEEEVEMEDGADCEKADDDGRRLIPLSNYRDEFIARTAALFASEDAEKREVLMPLPELELPHTETVQENYFFDSFCSAIDETDDLRRAFNALENYALDAKKVL